MEGLSPAATAADWFADRPSPIGGQVPLPLSLLRRTELPLTEAACLALRRVRGIRPSLPLTAAGRPA